LKNKDGMTLIEVMIAIVISFIVFLGLSGAGIFVLNENIKNELRDEAVSVAAMVMDNNVRNIPFDNLVIGAQSLNNVVRQIRGLTVTYVPTRTVASFTPDTRQVSIEVGWDRIENNQTKHFTHTITTIVRR
jgi:prepilin-type N-terminal cleavage/methylation domain-containing protein